MDEEQRLEFIEKLLYLHKYIGKHAPLDNASEWQKSLENKIKRELKILETQ